MQIDYEEDDNEKIEPVNKLKEEINANLDNMLIILNKAQYALPLPENTLVYEDVENIKAKIQKAVCALAFLRGYFDALGWQMKKKEPDETTPTQ